MKFDTKVSRKHRKAIREALDVILDKGYEPQKFIARQILDSKLLLRMLPISEMPGSGITGVIDASATNKVIKNERISVREAMAHVYITIANETIDVYGQRGLQGTLVHEGRHAYDFAQAIASFSDVDVNPLSIYNPTLYELEWEAHTVAAEYLLLIGKPDYLQEGVELLILGNDNGKHFVSYDGIKRRLQDSYGLNETDSPGNNTDKLLGLEINI